MFNLVPARNTHSLRTSDNIPRFNTKHSFFKNYFFPSTIIEWNKLDLTLRKCDSFNVFKKEILKFIRPSFNSFYNCHNPIGIKYITRSRLGLSHLWEHKFKQFPRLNQSYMQLRQWCWICNSFLPPLSLI